MILEYIWIDNYNNLRSKIKISNVISDYEDCILDCWNFDGSSTGQSTVENSEIIIRPVRMVKNPLFKEKALLILCECLNPDYTPHSSNKREEFYGIDFGIEQEYYIRPMNNSLGGSDNSHYCAVGIPYRDIVETHMKMCLEAELSICGVNAEVGLNQWEYQIGILNGVAVADELWISRYILQRVAERHNCTIVFDPILPHLPPSGCHVNFSIPHRGINSDEIYENVILKLEKNNTEFIKLCGSGTEQRLSGIGETCNYNNFTYGAGNRRVSIRIKDGYLEDRRPSANMNPYVVCHELVRIIDTIDD